jgi:hypothetical protein
MRWVWVITAALALPVSLPGLAAADPGTVSVTGDVRHLLALTRDALRAYPPQTQSVTFGTDTGPQAHVYEGAAPADVVTAADLAVEGARYVSDLVELRVVDLA